MTSSASRTGARATLVAACLAASLWLPSGAQAATPSFEQVRAAYRTSETVLLDRHGVPAQTVRTDLHARRGAWVPLAQISPALRAAAIASEDQRFLSHSGVDWSAVAGAAIGRANPGGTRGASTITMQLAGLLDPDLALTRGGRSMGTKIEQAAAALRIERTWSKDQILEAWLNLVPFRGEQVGVAAMSQALFQKAPSGLNAEESAIAAALLRAPNAQPAVVGQRACGVLKALGRADACATAQGFAELMLARASSASTASADPDEHLAPHFARQVLKAGAKTAPPATLRTTLDAGTQRRARDALRQQLAELRDRDVEDGAVIVLDNATGDVLAWVGSSGDLSQAAAVDAVLAPRQAGSTLKPFLYEQAIEQRWLTAASVLDDAPTRLHTPSGLYIPQNYDHDFKGLVSVRSALGASLNVPAVRTAVMVSPDRFARRLVALGPADPQARRLLWLQHRARLARGDAAVAGQRVPVACQRRARRRAAPAPSPRRACRRTDDTRHGPGRIVHRRRHPRRQRRPRAHLRPRQRARHALLDGGQDGHQQGHARQLVRRLFRALHGGRVGGQRQRRADACRLRRHRRRAGVAHGDGRAAAQRLGQRASGAHRAGVAATWRGARVTRRARERRRAVPGRDCRCRPDRR